MLHPASDGNPDVGGRAEEGGDGNVVEGAGDKVEEPLGVAGFIDDRLDPVVVDGVEGLGGVEEEEEAGELAGDAGEEEVVDVGGVGGAIATPQETLLRGVEEVDGGGHDGVGNYGGENAIVSVGDADGAGVGDEVGGFFGEKKEVGEIVVGRGGGAREEEGESVEENRTSDVGGGPPGGKRDAVWAGGSVLGVGNGGEDVVEGGVVDEGGVDLLVVRVENGGVGWMGGRRAGLPDFAPVVGSNLSHGLGGGGDVGVWGGLQALEMLVVVGEGAFDVGDGVGAFAGVSGGGGEGVEGR